jgi:branched-chain amino acid transport system substrate-binding protein
MNQATTKIKKEVNELKKIIFLIIASLLVIGLVLPGCEGEGEEFTNWITIGIAGPLTFIQGRDHVAGATMAMNEINDAGGVDVGGTPYGIKLLTADTNEILDTSGVTGTTALTAIIDDVDFVVGGFRTEALDVYRDVALEEGILFFDAGAATTSLCEDVFLDYDYFKYFFKATPYNTNFLLANCIRQCKVINTLLRAEAGLGAGNTTLALIIENAEWCIAFKPILEAYMPAYGFDVVSTQLPASDDTDLTTELNAIITDNGGEEPMMVFTVLSGPPGKAYGLQQQSILPHTFSVGINVESQDIDYHHDTGAEYHTALDTWAEDVALTPYTLDFWDDYMAETGRYPTYCAATYDVLNTLKLAIEDVGLATADLIGWFEDQDNKYTGTASTTTYYPMPALNVTPTIGALSPDQAYALYPHLPTYYGYASYAEMAGNWSLHVSGWTTAGGFVPHDTVFGPGWQTGQGVQWQPVDPEDPDGEWAKVGWFPMVLSSTGANVPAKDLSPAEMAGLKAAGLVDQYGNWNYAYPGAVALVIPDIWTDYWTP